MESFLIKAAQLILAFAFLVIIHEFGHLLMARAFGIKVEKYYIFFNPWFSLFKWKPKPPKKPKLDSNGNPRPTWRDTEYGIGWVPLGGYVKIAGMIDESMDTEQMAQPEQPWEFRAKPAYQRLLVMLGGVIFNFILAIIIYAGIAWHWGTKYIPFDNAYEGMDFVPSAQAIGFRNGDIPLLADGQKIDASQNDYAIKMVEAKTVSVLRNHRDTVDIAIPSDFIFRLNDDKGFMSYRMPVVVSATQGGTAASEAGLQKLDRIIAVDTISTPSFTEFAPTLAQYGGKPTTITIIRDGQEMKLPVTPSEGGKLGIMLAPITEIYPTVTTHYNIFQSVPKGIQLGTSTLTNYVGSMKHVFSSEGVQSLGGFGAIGSLFPEKWNWLAFWEITAFLSVALAFMNIIPIPGLDGGHVMFLLYEVVTRRKPAEKVLEYAQYAGMAFLLVLLLYANGNDIVRAFIR